MPKKWAGEMSKIGIYESADETLTVTKLDDAVKHANPSVMVVAST